MRYANIIKFLLAIVRVSNELLVIFEDILEVSVI